MLSDKKILFISHDASRSGAPIVLLHLLKWIKENRIVKFDILLKAGGDLENEFVKLGNVFILKKEEEEKQGLKRILSGIKEKLFAKRKESNFKALWGRSYDLIYFNTIAANDLIVELKQLFNCPVICHVHENEFTIKNYFPGSLNREIIQNVDRFIAVSESTKKSLITNFTIPGNKISLCYEFIDLKRCQDNVLEDAMSVKKRLGIEDGEFIVGAAGTCYWRKGTDLFLHLAYQIKKLDPTSKIRFIWVGGSYEKEYQLQLEYELKCLSLENNVIFTGHRHDPHNYYQIFDAFALMSREDPFPLVCLEAASLGKTILCFDQAGGMPELICEGGGIVLPYGDTRQMAKEMLSLYHDKTKLKVMGEQAQKIVQRFDVNRAGYEIKKIIESAI
ncbi:glycosyltransferase family 4 protein [Pararcticibacter amylolyticus]|uniref:Glycosyltransferase family 1 protein n=1 Tax=Pararcticibacter amylolyticus TaxID=2173175 RepID=A0A2U2PI53_9SPHI|nr:glycosyltransferase family 4 protein [Pararcticibacter amylolyticus]PWG81060.1 hypothetical protein DDR33_09035 [Pararcticibacter amylolyticus]